MVLCEIICSVPSMLSKREGSERVSFKLVWYLSKGNNRSFGESVGHFHKWQVSTDGEGNQARAKREEVTGGNVCEVLFDQLFATFQCSEGQRELEFWPPVTLALGIQWLSYERGGWNRLTQGSTEIPIYPLSFCLCKQWALDE